MKREDQINGLALCAGVGGLEAGLHLVFETKYRTVCAVERQAYAASALLDWIEKAGLGAPPVWDDVSTFDPGPWRECVDIITAGYPCQPFSVAGLGLGEDDPRHLWPHVRRIVRAIKPAVCFCENVPGHIANGYETVRRDLERAGYRVAQGIYSAAECGAPHLRERLFILGVLGNAEHGGLPGRNAPGQRTSPIMPSYQVLANPESNGRSEGRAEPTREQGGSGLACGGAACPEERGELGDAYGARPQNGWPELSIESRCAVWPWPAGRGQDQYPWEHPRTVEPGLGRAVDGVDTRSERVFSIGNGVVPVVAAMAFVDLWGKLME